MIIGSENPQKAHYEGIHQEYVAHYFDAASVAYRKEFLFRDFPDLSGKRIADLGCSSGGNSEIVRGMFPGVTTEGFDISEEACADYRRRIGPASCCDFTRPQNFSPVFDAAMSIGFLHHCVMDLDAALANTAAMLKPGGFLLAWEPNRNCFLEPIRKLWYRWDRYFEADTERALVAQELTAAARQHFELVRLRYVGGPAYFLVLNSLVMRLPLSAKRHIRRLSFPLERAYELLPGRVQFATFVAIYQKRAEVDSASVAVQKSASGTHESQ